MSRWWLLVLVVVAVMPSRPASADVDPFIQQNLLPEHDTFATHNDNVAHGGEPVIKVGIEPQECFLSGWDPCDDDDMVCCETGETYNYCAPSGTCGSSAPIWKAHRKFRGYIRFDLSGLPKFPEAKVVSANLRFQEMGKVEELGGPVNVIVTRLKKIGNPDPICEWDEDTLNDTNGTTWNSLPQNLSITPEGAWAYDVTQAMTDWLESMPPAENCGFQLYDPDFGKPDNPIQRWVVFSSKEGGFPPQLQVTLAKDLDSDGHYGDCNEEDPDINPGAAETCDGVDQDCDGDVDEENCDGLDNDCDGQIDEGENLCGDGQLCIFHECVVTCQDECGGGWDTTCVFNDDTGLWEKWGCGDKDGDPCLEYYKAMDCKEGWFCNWGSCSSNCVDDCDEDEIGDLDCTEDNVGNLFVAECGDWDGDGCLEWGNLDACPPSASCEDATCLGGCTDECPELGLTECVDELEIRACYDFDLDGCLEWTAVGACEPETQYCDGGECKLTNPPCVDDCAPGSTKCETFDDGNSFLYPCVEDGDEDPCFEWGTPEACPFACYPDGLDCADELPVEPQPDIVEWEFDIGQDVTSDLGVDTGGVSPDTGGTQPDGGGAAEVTVPVDQQHPSIDDGAVSSGGDSGCTTSTGHPAAGLLLLLLLAVLSRLCRRRYV